MIKKWILAIFIIIFIAIIFYFELHNYLTFQYLKANLDEIKLFYTHNNLMFTLSYFMTFIVIAALAIPGATILTLGGSAIMGFSKSILIISFASTIGATLSFLISRYFLKGYISKKFPIKTKIVNDGIKKDGVFYLLSLRLIPIFPFFLINILMGLTSISIRKYYITSQLGMFIGTMIYSNAGVQLATLNSLNDIINFQIFLSLCLIGLFPIFAKSLISFIKTSLLK